MKKIAKLIWEYFKSMNSEAPEAGGGISIKRNVAWILTTITVFVQAFSLVALYHLITINIEKVRLMDIFEYLCLAYIIVDAAMILLTLQITSIEKLNALAQTFKGNVSKATEEITEENKDKNKPEQK